jgi:hypothetical protein
MRSRDERNTDYADGLELLLEKLGAAGLPITEVLVESRETTALPREQRRLVLGEHPYPITVKDAGALRRAVSAAQTQIGRAPGAKGAGNRTRRLRVFLGAGPGAPADEELRRRLQRGR